jgi:hypothetical protein
VGDDDKPKEGSPAGLATMSVEGLVRSVTPGVVQQIHRSLVGALQRSVATPGREVAFAVGLGVGAFVAVIGAVVLNTVYPLSAPMAAALVLALSLSSGLVCARVLPFKDAFTRREVLVLERAKHLFDLESSAVDALERQLKEGGVAAADVQARVGPERTRAFERYRQVLAQMAKDRNSVREVLSGVEGPRALAPADGRRGPVQDG